MTPDLTEAQVMALAEYAALTSEERAEVDARWAETPEWRKDDLRAEVEFDLA